MLKPTLLFYIVTVSLESPIFYRDTTQHPLFQRHTLTQQHPLFQRHTLTQQLPLFQRHTLTQLGRMRIQTALHCEI